MDDKFFELMTKMYSEFSEFRKDISEKIENISKEQLRQGVILENEVQRDVKVLFDGYKQTYEKVTSIENKVDELSSKMEKQEVEIKVIRGGKQTNA